MNGQWKIKRLMQRLINVMQEKGVRAPNYFNLGIARQEILELSKGIVEISNDVIELYEFMNGTTATPNDPGGDWIMFGVSILPLQRALEEHSKLITSLGDNEPLSTWMRDGDINIHGWLPIMSDGSNHCVIDVNRSSHNEPCVFGTDEASDPELSYMSLESMLCTIISCYEQGAYIFDDGILVDWDMEKIDTITGLYNPNLEAAQSSLFSKKPER